MSCHSRFMNFKKMHFLGKEMTKSWPVLPADAVLNQGRVFGVQNKIWVLSLTGLPWSRQLVKDKTCANGG